MNQNLSGRRRTGGRAAGFFWGLSAGLVLGAAVMWSGLYVYAERVQAQAIAQLNERLQHVQAELDELYARRDVLEGQLTVERGTRKGLETTLDVVQDELGAARDQIAFFSELLPPGPNGSVSVRGLDIQQKGRMLEFRVLLMRHGAGDKPFEGMLQFQANGRVAGEPVTVNLDPVQTQTQLGEAAGSVSETGAVANPILTLEFDQFQRSSGLLQLPEGLELDDVTLNVFEGQTLRVSRTVNLLAQPLTH